jgi:hypothetical protein
MSRPPLETPIERIFSESHASENVAGRKGDFAAQTECSTPKAPTKPSLTPAPPAAGRPAGG